MANTINDYKKAIMEIFQQYEVPCFIQDAKETLFNYRYNIVLKDVKSLTQVNKITKALQMSLHNQNISCEEGNLETAKTTMIPLSIVIPKEKVEVIGYSSIRKRKVENDNLALYAVDENGNPVYHDFDTDGNILLYGDYGTGKTMFEKVLMKSLLRNEDKKIIVLSYDTWYRNYIGYKQVVLPKKSDYGFSLYEAFDKVRTELRIRHNKKDLSHVKPLYIFVDVNEQTEYDNETIFSYIKNNLKDFTSKKLYMILSLSRLQKVIVENLRYFGTKIILKTETASSSVKLIGSTTAYALQFPGVAIVKNNKKEQIVRILDVESTNSIKPKTESNSEISENEVLETLEEYNSQKNINIITKNFIEKCGKLYYLDLFVTNNGLISNDSSKTECLNIAKHTLQTLSNANEIFYECQRIKNETDDSVLGNESLYLDKATFSNYKELVFLCETLVGQNMIENDDLHKTAFYLFVYEKYDEYLKELYETFSKKYNLQKDDEGAIINEMLSAGYGIQEIKNYLALKQYCEQGNKEMSYDVCVENLGTKVEDAFKVMKQKKYIESLLNVNKQTKKTTLHDIDRMSGKEFEEFIAELFTNFGYETTITKASADQGIDVLATKQDVTIGIQAKCYSGQVGNHAIMEAVAGCKYYKANKCMVITNSTFTPSAIKLAEANDVELWDRNVLERKMEEVL